LEKCRVDWKTTAATKGTTAAANGGSEGQMTPQPRRRNCTGTLVGAEDEDSGAPEGLSAMLGTFTDLCQDPMEWEICSIVAANNHDMRGSQNVTFLMETLALSIQVNNFGF
jgi:hypothetical protein